MPSCGARMSTRRNWSFRRDLALDELADLVIGLAQILGDFADQILVDLNDL